MNELDTRVRARLYVRIDESTELAYEDVEMTPEEAQHRNDRYIVDKKPFRFRPYATRDGDSVAA